MKGIQPLELLNNKRNTFFKILYCWKPLYMKVFLGFLIFKQKLSYDSIHYINANPYRTWSDSF